MLEETRGRQDVTARSRYRAPTDVREVRVDELLRAHPVESDKAKRLTLPGLSSSERNGGDQSGIVFCSGRLELTRRKAVAIIGARKVSEKGAARARRLARDLAQAGVVTLSGLAEGVDYNAHTAAIEAGGDTIAVIGTPIDKAYPAKHAELQEQIYRQHLLVSQFPIGSKVFPSNFPQRNKLMAAMSDATVIAEASDTSGSLHQAAECKRIGRWLFIMRSVVENPELTWPKKFIEYPMVKVLDDVGEVLEAIGARGD